MQQNGSEANVKSREASRVLLSRSRIGLAPGLNGKASIDDRLRYRFYLSVVNVSQEAMVRTAPT